MDPSHIDTIANNTEKTFESAIENLIPKIQMRNEIVELSAESIPLIRKRKTLNKQKKRNINNLNLHRNNNKKKTNKQNDKKLDSKWL